VSTNAITQAANPLGSPVAGNTSAGNAPVPGSPAARAAQKAETEAGNAAMMNSITSFVKGNGTGQRFQSPNNAQTASIQPTLDAELSKADTKLVEKAKQSDIGKMNEDSLKKLLDLPKGTLDGPTLSAITQSLLNRERAS
jgi:hypothetical protein